MTKRYQGSCHCGAIKFAFDSNEITRGLRCNCSVCRRKGALMNLEVVAVEDLAIEADPADLGLYQFGNGVAKHYFCKRCGIYTHNETLRMPGKCRVNLGCIDEIDTETLEFDIFDGKNLL